MSVRRHSCGSGSVSAGGRGAGVVAVKDPIEARRDLRPSEPVAHARGILFEEGWAAVSRLLDGDAVPSAKGWNCVSFDGDEVGRVLWVSRNCASSMHDALLRCRSQGVLVEKLEKMPPLEARLTHLLAIPRPERPS